MKVADLEAAVWLAAAACGAALGVRLFTVVAAGSLGAAATALEGTAPSASTPAPNAERRSEQLLELARQDEDAGVGTATVARRMLRPQLLVTTGPARSAVVVDGVELGRTPFIGEIGCREGDVVKVYVDPPSGEPVLYSGRCEGETIRVER